MLIQNSSLPPPSHEDLVEPIKYEQYNILKNKIDVLHHTLDKFTKDINNLNLLLCNQRGSCNKVGLGYEPKKILKFLAKYIM